MRVRSFLLLFALTAGFLALFPPYTTSLSGYSYPKIKFYTVFAKPPPADGAQYRIDALQLQKRLGLAFCFWGVVYVFSQVAVTLSHLRVKGRQSTSTKDTAGNQ